MKDENDGVDVSESQQSLLQQLERWLLPDTWNRDL